MFHPTGLRNALVALILLVPVCAGAQTTLATETGNNTSACAAAGSPSYCQAGFTGMSDATSGVYNPPPGNVSNVDIHEMLYPNSSTLVVAHFQAWFCMNRGSTVTGTGTLCDSHIQVGYKSSDPATVDGQINDMVLRGFNAIEVDWYGTRISPNPHEATAAAIRANLDARCTIDSDHCPLLALLEDDGAFKWTGCPYDGGGTDRTSCITNALKSDLLYMDQNYFGHSSYLRVNTSGVRSTSGQPVVSFFICEECFTNPAPNWSSIWNNVRAYADTLSHPPLFLFRNSDGFSHTQTNGSFAWVNWGSSDPYGVTYLDNFYDAAVAHPSLLPMGTSWKGFDETNAPWVSGGARIMSQQCGLTWLRTFQQLAHNGDYTGSRTLPFFGVVTWNDYEEGTEIETGIDNCMTALSASVSGSVLSWVPTFATVGSESTVHHYVVFDTVDGQNLAALATVPAFTHSINLDTLNLYTGTQTLYVKAVGQPSIRNHMSNAVTYAQGVPAPVTLSTLTVNPATVTAGGSSQGTVTLTAPAPTNDNVSVWSSDPAGSVPANVAIAQGATSATFTITTNTVQSATEVTISASYGGVTRTALLTVNPAQPANTPFSIVVLPDAQNYNNYAPPNSFGAIMNWIAANRATWNIQAVMGEGDITNDGSYSPYWHNAAAALPTLDNSGIPYVLALGNHDYDTMYPASGRLVTGYLNDDFAPATHYTSHQCPGTGCWFIGDYPAGTYRNLRADLTINGKSYILLALELYPPAGALTWADGIIAANPEAEVLISTHAFLFPDDNTRVDSCNGDPQNWGLDASNSSDAEVMWHSLIRKYPNVSLVVNGHFSSGTTIYASHRMDLGLNGNLVNQIIADYQDFPNGGNGYIRILTFDDTANTISVKTYSPTLNQFLTEAKSQFTVPWHTSEPGGSATLQGFVKRASDCSAISGATVSATGPGGSFTTATLANGSFSLGVSAIAGSPNVYNVQVSGNGIATAFDQASAFTGFPAFLKFHVSPATTVSLSRLTVNPTTVTGGTSSQGTVTLSAAAPSNISVALSSNDPAATVPLSVTVSQGATSATFTITTNTVTVSTSVTISAVYSGVTQNAVLMVNPVVAPTLLSLTVSPTSVRGGSSARGTVTLTGPALAGGAVISLSTNSSVATVPSSITIPAGATSGSFTIGTSRVSVSVVVTVTATYNGSTASALLTVKKRH